MIVPMQTLREGDRNSDVIVLQKLLGLPRDSIFGPLTLQAVMEFQATHSLDVDGVVGPLTWAALQGATPPVVIPPTTSGIITKGVDIYHGDDVTSWAKLKAASWEFVFIKASENYSNDTMFSTNWANAKAADLLRGAYHFIHFNGDGSGQAQVLWKQLEAHGFEDTDLPPVLDFEKETDFHPSDINICVDFMDEIKKLSGRKPIIYLSRSTPDAMNNPSVLAQYTNWIASYTSTLHVPAPWTDWQFWQNSGDGLATGISNKCDIDKFNGSVDELRAFIKASKI